MKTGALLLASFDLAGQNTDSEEFPLFLPMYPLDGTTVIKREISILRRAAVSPVILLTGYQKDVLKNHLSHNNVIFAENEEYQTNSHADALKLGLETASQYMDRVIVVPVEYPAFSLQTVQALLECGQNTTPACNGQEGWPRLYVFRDEDGHEMEQTQNPEILPVDDEGILLSLLEQDGIPRIQHYLKTQHNINELHCKTKLVLSKEEDFFGPGIYYLLQYIDETGSIQGAATKMEMSYSKCWKMINKVEREMGFPFLNRSNGGKSGGSSKLTAEGRLFMERYHAMIMDMERISQNFFDVYFNEFQ